MPYNWWWYIYVTVYDDLDTEIIYFYMQHIYDPSMITPAAGWLEVLENWRGVVGGGEGGGRCWCSLRKIVVGFSFVLE